MLELRFTAKLKKDYKRINVLSLQLKIAALAQDPESYERYLRLAGCGTTE